MSIAGGLATRVGPWYRALEKPGLNPPDWVFAPAWTAIYALCVAAAVYGWRAAETNAQRSWLLSLFFFNAVANIAWSFIFFTLERPDWALAEVAVLWATIAALIGFFSTFSRRSAFLLAPYLAWVSFAAYLNLGIVRVNGPFA